MVNVDPPAPPPAPPFALYCGSLRTASSAHQMVVSDLPLADLAQDFCGVLAELRRGPLRRHGPPADDDRRAYARNLTALCRRARPVDPHAAMYQLRVAESLVETTDPPS